MVGAQLLSFIDERLKQGKGCEEDFGGVFVFLLGDIRQLPPVCDAPLYQPVDWNDSLAKARGKLLFNNFDGWIELSQVHRQDDPRFKDILNSLSVGDVTSDGNNILQSRFRSSLQPCEQAGFQDAIHLFPTVDKVASYNTRKLENLKCARTGNPAPIARIPAIHRSPGAKEKASVEGLVPCLYLAVGCRIMLYSNLWTSKGLVNGAIGTVVDILYEQGKSSPEDQPDVIVCKFESYQGPYLDDALKTVPIPAITKYWTTAYDVQNSRKQFPLNLAYACTIHKPQGLSLSKVSILM